MLKIDLISFPRLTVLISLWASMDGVKPAVAQQHYSHPRAAAYTEVTRNVAPSPWQRAQGIPSLQRTVATRQTFTATSQPFVTSVQMGPAYAPPQFPLTARNYAAPHSWPGAAASYSPQTGQPIYCYGAAYPECTDSCDEGPCNWFCQTQKKLRSLYRASHRRSECKFEYPVLFPSGCPYGYVEPTWSQFCAEPAPQFIGPAR